MAKFFDVPFAEQGDKDPVPTDAQPNGSVSYITGYTPDYEIDLDIDDPNAKPVERGSMNDLFHDITDALGFIQKHGAADWSTAGKPYALNDIVRFGDKNWLSLAPVNNDQPAEGSSWTEFSAQVLKGKLERIAIVQVAGNNTDKIMSQKAVSDAVALKLDKSSVKQSSGNSSSDIMSQRAVGESINAAIAPKADSVTVNQQLALKLDKSSVKTATGTSSTDVMSQKTVTDALNTKVGLSGNQTIAGVKTFSSFPVTPSAAPTANYQAANKKYVDDSAIGVGQTWQNVTASRALNTAYTNTTGRTIVVAVQIVGSDAGSLLYVDGMLVSVNDVSSASTSAGITAQAPVPPDSTYLARDSGGRLLSWVELR